MTIYAYSPFIDALVEIDPDQAWFWTSEWLDGELEAERDIRNGDYQEYDSVDDFIASL